MNSSAVRLQQERILKGPLRRSLFYLALPVLLEQVLSFLVGFVDMWLSGRLGATETSAIGFGAYVLWLAWMLFATVSVGTTAIVSRCWGAGHFRKARAASNRSLALGLVVGSLLGLMIAALAPVLSQQLGQSDEVQKLTVTYIRGTAIGLPAACLMSVGTAALRGAGYMYVCLWIMTLINLLNAGLSAALVFGWGLFPEWGVTGIIVGTVVSEYVGVSLLFLFLIFGKSGLTLRLREWHLKGKISQRILKIGWPAAWDGLLSWSGQFFFLMIIARLAEGEAGTVIVAAHMVGVHLEGISYLPAVAWGQAAATMIGQSLGAAQNKRAFNAGYEATRQCGLFALFLTLIFFFGADALYRLMHQDPTVVATGSGPFKMIAFFEVPLVVFIVLTFSLRGAGVTRPPMFVNLFCVYAIRIPVAWYLGINQELGLWGAWIGMCADTLLRALLIGAFYQWGKWCE